MLRARIAAHTVSYTSGLSRKTAKTIYELVGEVAEAFAGEQPDGMSHAAFERALSNAIADTFRKRTVFQCTCTLARVLRREVVC